MYLPAISVDCNVNDRQTILAELYFTHSLRYKTVVARTFGQVIIPFFWFCFAFVVSEVSFFLLLILLEFINVVVEFVIFNTASCEFGCWILWRDGSADENIVKNGDDIDDSTR